MRPFILLTLLLLTQLVAGWLPGFSEFDPSNHQQRPNPNEFNQQYPTNWDFYKAKYVEYLSQSNFGILVKEAHEAIKILQMTDDDWRMQNRQEDEIRRAKIREKLGIKPDEPEPAQPKNKKGYAADDELDLIPVLRNVVQNRTMHPDLIEAEIRRLDEPYPSLEMTCSAKGQLEMQNQLHYFCKSPFFHNSEYFRVIQEDYAILSLYIEDFECYLEQVETPVCMCAPGNTDFLCDTQIVQSCFVNITNPPLYEGCMDQKDSDFYMYSLGGFAPCFFYDFKKEYTFELTLECKVLVKKSTEASKPTTTTLVQGYQYRDVTKKAQNTETEFTLGGSWADSLTVSFNVRDMKYLSNSNQTTVTTTDADVMAGKTPLELTLNFKDLLTQDESGDTYFVVGGRTYYEATVSGENTVSFLAKGFFDQEGYSMPAVETDWTQLVIACSIAAACLFVVVVLCICYKRRNDEIARIKSDAKFSDLIDKPKTA